MARRPRLGPGRYGSVGTSRFSSSNQLRITTLSGVFWSVRRLQQPVDCTDSTSYEVAPTAGPGQYGWPVGRRLIMPLGTSIRGPLLPLLVVSLAFFSSNNTTTLQGKHRAPTVTRSGDVAVIEDDGSSPPGVGIGLARQSGDRPGLLQPLCGCLRPADRLVDSGRGKIGHVASGPEPSLVVEHDPMLTRARWREAGRGRRAAQDVHHLATPYSIGLYPGSGNRPL